MSGREIVSKKNHHYVWSHYLRRWSMDEKKVWRTTEKGKIDLQNTSAFAKDDFFYKASPVSLAQVEIIGLLFRDASRRVKDKHLALLKEVNAIQRISNLVSTLQTDDTNIHRHLKALWSNIIEDKHTAHELAARPILDELAKGEMSVLEDPEAFENFVVFFAHQLTRTKAIRERSLPGNGSWVQEGDDSEDVFEELRKCDWLLGYMTGIHVADSILSTRQQDKHCLINNETEEPFITSDQPVTNVHTSIAPNSGRPPADDECDFFFPISPTKAYLISNSSVLPEGVSSATVDMVRHVNERIARSSRRYIVGDRKDIIARYKRFVPLK